MAANKTLRWLSIFDFLTSNSAGLTCEQILSKVHQCEYLGPVDLRTIQRDMKEMAESGVVRVTSWENDAGRVVWARNAVRDVMTPLAASTLKLSLRFMKGLLPPAALESLASQEERADRVLRIRGNGQPGLRRWADKVRVVPGGHVLQPPHIRDEVATTVYEALATERQIRATYRRPGQTETTTRNYSVLALIARPPKYQLLVRVDRDPFVLNLHRIQSAELLDSSCQWPPEFDLDAWLDGGGINTLVDSTADLVLRTTPAMADLWDETPLGEGQCIERHGGHARVRVTLVQTDALRRYLLGLGSQVVVEAPESLRSWLRDEARRIVAQLDIDPETAGALEVS